LKREHAPSAYASGREEATDIGFRTLGRQTDRGIGSVLNENDRRTKRSEMNSLITLKLGVLEDAIMTERLQRENVEEELQKLRRKVTLRASYKHNHRDPPPGVSFPMLTKKRNGDFVSHGLTRRVPKISRIKEPYTRQIGQAQSLPRLDHRNFFKDKNVGL
jgi:hypothetical protein